jgi:hypothetical protein
MTANQAQEDNWITTHTGHLNDEIDDEEHSPVDEDSKYEEAAERELMEAE